MSLHFLLRSDKKHPEDEPMKLTYTLLLLLFALTHLVLPTQSAFARPSYAARSGVVSCTGCHVSPAGGGIRTSAGKAFGARGFQMSQWQIQEYAQVDTRMIYYQPERSQTSHSGLGLMSTILSTQIPLRNGKGTEQPGPARFVASYDFGQFNAGQRATYVMWVDEEAATSIDRNTVILGRFQVPFGLMTDEHKTYVRMQTATSYNDFKMGAMYSKTTTPNVHYDLALVNGLQTAATEGSGRFSAGPTGGVYVNARLSPQEPNYYGGVSLAYNYRHGEQQDLWAASLYSAIPLDSMRARNQEATLLLEVSTAQGFTEGSINPDISRFFYAGNSTYQSLVEQAQSIGYMARFNWYFTNRWMAFYKFDSLTLNIDYPADAFLRHGVGFKHWLSANSILQTRVEIAKAGHPAIAEENLGEQETVFLVYHFWF